MTRKPEVNEDSTAGEPDKRRKEDDARIAHLGVYSIKIARDLPYAKLPVRKSAFAAGHDLFTAVKVEIPSRSRALIPTGLVMEIPSGLFGRIASRSGLSLKKGIEVGAGIIDSDYRGVVGVVLHNHSDVPVVLEKGEAIAQIIFIRCEPCLIQEVDAGEMSGTARGQGGFGSTDVQKT